MPKKKRAKGSKKSAAAAAEPFVCATNPSTGEHWKSKINTSNDDGVVLINPEDAQGNFDGTQVIGPDVHPIQGRCLGDGMWFVRPASAPKYFYSGKFQGAGNKKIKGKRQPLDAVALAPDDWTGEKGT